MPIYLRRYYLQKASEFYKQEEEQYKKARSKSGGKVHKPPTPR